MNEYHTTFLLGCREGKIDGIAAPNIGLADKIVRRELRKRYPNSRISVIGVYKKGSD